MTSISHPTDLAHLINLDRYPIDDRHWLDTCRAELDQSGVIVLKAFLAADAVSQLQKEAEDGLKEAYFNPQTHTIYLSPPDPQFAPEHIRNRQVLSSKGCICDDQIDARSVLKQLYHHPVFQQALCVILQEKQLYPYADSLSSVNIHYARKGEELNWHFDNSSFAVTLMISPATAGGHFEYVKNVRRSDRGDMGFETAEQIINGTIKANTLNLDAGDLCLFRGRDSLHRVSPVADNSVRQLAVLAYNHEPGICLSPAAQQTFYGRVDTAS